MANQMTGRIHIIHPTTSIASKADPSKTYSKRLLTLDCTKFDQYTGERGFANYPTFEFSGDKCSSLDQFKPGQVVTVSFDLQGNEITGNDGKPKWFTSIRGFRIEKRVITHAQPQAQPPQPEPSSGLKAGDNVSFEEDKAPDDLPF